MSIRYLCIAVLAAPLLGQSLFYPLTPCRIADTRAASGFTGAFGGPSIAAAATRSFPIPSGGCNVPAAAIGYSLNFTVIPSGALNYLTAWPTGQSQPGTSTLNSGSGAVVANAAIVPAGTAGAISVYASNATDLVIDVNGYFGALPVYTEEVPGGVLNGTNGVFTLANTPAAGWAVTVVWNGLVLHVLAGDYTISGAAITLAAAPQPGDKLIAAYYH